MSTSTRGGPAAPRTNLSHILTASAACHILGQDVVRPIVRAFLRYVAAGLPPPSSSSAAVDGGEGGRTSPRFTGPDDPAAPFRPSAFPSDGLNPEEGEEESEWVEHFGRALFHDFTGGGEDAMADEDSRASQPDPDPVVPPSVTLAWRRMVPSSGGEDAGGAGAVGGGSSGTAFPSMGLNKSSVLRPGALFPSAAAPRPGPGGHLALMECVFQALAYVPPSSGGSGAPPPAPPTPQKSRRGSRENAAALKSAVEQRMMSASASVHGRARSVVLLPDLLIMFAVCRRFREECSSRSNLANVEGRRYATLLASLLAFRVYDSYQKRGHVVRETVQRFLSDVHGEEHCRGRTVRRVLDAMFTVDAYEGGSSSSALGSGSKPPSSRQLKPTEFCRSIANTINVTSSGRSYHVLLDWIIALGNGMLPSSLVPPSSAAADGGPSVRELLRAKRLMVLEGDADRAVRRLCRQYGLGRKELYEARRRFRSVVEEATAGKSAKPCSRGGTSSSGGGGGKLNGEERRLPICESEGRRAVSSSSQEGDSSSSGSRGVPHNALHVDAFVRAASEPDSEMGHGGFLTPTLARLAFDGGRIVGQRLSGGTPNYWTLYDALGFGCRALREEVDGTSGEEDVDADRSLLELVFEAFLLLPAVDEERGGEGDGDGGGVASESEVASLSRAQIGRMIVLLLEHSAFRLQADSPPPETEPSGGKEKKKKLKKSRRRNSNGSGGSCDNIGEEHGNVGNNEEKVVFSPNVSTNSTLPSTVNATSASLLGMLPLNLDGDDAVDERGGVRLDVLVDYVLDESLGPHGDSGAHERPLALDLPSFLRWHRASRPGSAAAHLPASERRVGPYLQDLRLLAGILFGVKPSDPDMERTLVEEVMRRHKYRYPVMEPSSKRGPPGTAWYVMAMHWWMRWGEHAGRAPAGGRRRQRSPSFSTADESSSMASSVEVAMGNDGDAGDDAEEQSFPGPIDNDILLVPGSLALRRGLKWRRDFELLPPLAWSALQAWHDGGPPIRRMVVSHCTSVGSSTSGSVTGGFGSMGSSGRKSVRLSSSRRGTFFNPSLQIQNEIELYPIFVNVLLCDSASGGTGGPWTPRPFQQSVPLSRYRPLRELHEDLCRRLGGVSPRDARLWMAGASMSLLRRLESETEDEVGGGGGEAQNFILYLDTGLEDQLQEKGVSLDVPTESNSGGEKESPEPALIFELRNVKDGAWPLAMQNNSMHSGGSHGGDSVESGKGDGLVGDGIIGLYNMGKTSYLNASIQCLSRTPILRDYFTSETYLEDINPMNPLGQEGELARVSATLINEMWKRTKQRITSVPPKNSSMKNDFFPVQAPALMPKSFKQAFVKFFDHFAGNEERDALELLVHLLDALSEDLNRIVGERKTDSPESDNGRSDQELADIWWSNHLKQKLSIIAVLFTGQFKCRLTCQSCKNESVTFGLKNFLELPLPEDDTVSVRLILYPLGDAEVKDVAALPTEYVVRTRHDGTIFDVLVSLSKILHSDRNEGKDDAESECDDEGRGMLYLQMAQNMAVVKMKEGYVYKVFPNKWSLSKLQDNETGELDLLHVFELDFKNDGNNRVGDENAAPENSSGEADGVFDNAGSATNGKINHSYLTVAQRRLDLVGHPLFHPCSQGVFGTPLLLRVEDLEGYTGRDLYDLVARKVRKLVPKSAWPYLLKGRSTLSTSTENGTANLEHDKSEGKKRQRHRTMMDMEDASAGQLPRYGFRLRMTSRDGRHCSLCKWFECCIGCPIPDDECPTAVENGDSISLDWHIRVDLKTSGFGLRADESTDSPHGLKKHRTAHSNNDQKKSPVTLDECFEAFAMEERIPSSFCSRCNEARVQTRQMSVWRLPPVLMIRLKRFKLSGQMKMKVRDLVLFPLEGLALSQAEMYERNSEAEQDGSTAESDTTISEEEEQIRSRIWSDASGQDGETGKSPRGDGLYDLYGVIHHHGPLSGGHYTASLKSHLDGKWRLFNDAQIYEVNASDVVDPSAYILFYVRSDVMSTSLKNFWDVQLQEHGRLSDDEAKRIIHDRDKCAIS